MGNGIVLGMAGKFNTLNYALGEIAEISMLVGVVLQCKNARNAAHDRDLIMVV